MGFAVPMIWRQQRDHITDCYFCLTKTKGCNQRNRKKILYPNLPSAIRPVPHSADVCADLKVVALLRGLQLGYTKYCCFLCLWDSRARNKHYIEKIWPQRIEEVEGQHNVVALPLVPQNKIILPPMHVKLRLFKHFVKGLRKDSPTFEYLHECFPKLSDAKIKGVSVEPQIRKLILNDMFDILKLHFHIKCC